MHRLGKFLRLSSSEQWLLLEAAIWLGIAKLSLLIIPFRWIAPFLGRQIAETPEREKSEQKNIAEQISWAVQTASKHLPWECNCLAQAIAGKTMLTRRGITSTLYLGLTKNREENLKAHAWLRSGNVIVIGAQGMNQFKVISAFAEKRT
jgi:hypothetical protein